MNVTILNKTDTGDCKTYGYYADITGLQLQNVLYRDKVQLRPGENNMKYLHIICPREMNPRLLKESNRVGQSPIEKEGYRLIFNTPPKYWCIVKYRHNYIENNKTIYVLELTLEQMQSLNNDGDGWKV